jgi:Holliday junction resolvasome RuvABC ATP-dependent DNA helicase subunit
MATQAGKAKATSTTKSKASAKPVAKPAAKPAPSRKDQAQSFAQTAVDLHVGAVLEATDRVTELVDPFTNRSGAERQLKSYRTRLRRIVKRTERRGATARRKAATEARKTRNRVEREARKRQRTVKTTLKRNRSEVEQRVRQAVEEQTTRAQDLVDQVGEQLSALR